jgi:hypothetical protein
MVTFFASSARGKLTRGPGVKLNLRVWLHNNANKLSVMGLEKFGPTVVKPKHLRAKTDDLLCS